MVFVQVLLFCVFTFIMITMVDDCNDDDEQVDDDEQESD